MKVKRLTFLVFAFLLCTVASAQSYSVRVTHNTNLRASFSLDARIVDTALAGATLSVTGSQEGWLMIDRNGREVWLADWVPMTRVEGGPVSADINNCCFVDRQCNTDGEWTAGYWAFQNNQCGAPKTTEQVSTAAPISSVPANVSNCCNVDRHCDTDHEWTQGYWAYHTHQCGAPGSHRRAVDVIGSPGFIHMIERAFQLLQEWAPDWYRYVVSALPRVRQESGGHGTGIYIESVTVGVDSNIQTVAEVSDDLVIDMVGTLAHESCHVHQWWDGTATEGWRNEIGCVRAQLAATEAVDPHDRFSPWLRNLIANIEDPAYWWW